MRRLSIVIPLVLTGLAAGTAPAYAATPTNDEPATAAVIPALPSTIVQDTTGATYVPYGGCTSGDAGANVWFSFTATDEVRVEIDTSSSDYNTGLNVFAGMPSDGTWLTCSERSVRFVAEPGTTYFVEVAACCGSGAGGQLVLQAQAAAPPPTVDVTVDSVGQFNARTGNATVTGTATCASSVVTAVVEVFLAQQVGRVSTVTGQNGIFVGCEPGGPPVPWSVTIAPGNGEYRGGAATASVQAVGCNNTECSATNTETKITLRR